MKTITLITTFLLSIGQLQSQKLPATELLYLTATANRVLHTAEGKNAQGRTPKDSIIGSRYLIKKLQGQKAYLQYRKLNVQAYAHFKQTLLTQNFLQGKLHGEVPTELFQKKDITITAKADPQQPQWFDITIDKRDLPRIRDLQFAEDLLAYDSHLHLELACGPQNVRKDLFYNVDGTTVNCSVIYPGSSREVVFLWQDAANFRKLDCIRIGGNMHTAGAMRHNNVLAQNQWMSRQGLYATMTLGQLQSRNGNALNFYGWGGGARANLCGNNSGNIDFSTLDLAFSCLNCNDDAYYGKQQLASDRAIEDGRRIFIATMIFYPPARSNE
jgi:hypothetical protein